MPALIGTSSIAIGSIEDDATCLAALCGVKGNTAVKLKHGKDASGAQRIVEIQAMRCKLSGAAPPLPPMLVVVNLACNGFSGGFDFTCLPMTLQELNISGNNFSGEADLTQLPSQLAALNIADNRFAGNLNLSRLPIKLLAIHAQNNQFAYCGVPVVSRELMMGAELMPVEDFNFANLPFAFRHLNISGNPFRHTINVSTAPKGVTIWLDDSSRTPF